MNYDLIFSIYGLLVCLTPFILVSNFKNKLNGFVTIFTVLAGTHLLVALVTQVAGIFTYGVVVGIHTLIAGYSLYIYLKSRDIESFKKIASGRLFLTNLKETRKSFFVVFVFCLFFVFLYTLRFNYTGVVDTVFGLKDVSNSSYTYPMYSDEWVGSSLAQYSIKTKTLPLVNPFYGNVPFLNFLMASHSLFAELILVLNLNPLTQYVHLADINAFLIFLALFLIQRSLSVSRTISSVTAFSVVLITNSGNLPGVWYILPYTASFTFFLYSILGYVIKSRLALFINGLISMILYPPIIVFIVPLFIGISYGKNIIFERGIFTVLRTALVFLIGIGALTLFSLKEFSFNQIFDRAMSFVLRNSLDGGIIDFDIWNILPFFILPGVLFGLFNIIKNKKTYLTYPICVGFIFWIVYSQTTKVLFIEYSRVVLIVCMLLIIVAGIGYQSIYQFLKEKISFLSNNSILLIYQVIIAVFLVSILSSVFNKMNLWHKSLMFRNLGGEHQVLMPAPPITRYVTEDDILLFSTYSGKRFISPSWKGLVIGVSTDNTPLDSKSSTLTNKILKYEVFEKADCKNKVELAIKYKLDLVYTSSLDCAESFEKVGRSREGLVLYEFRGR